MTSQRQQAFQQLRPPCVELSSVALKFRAKQASVKQVLSALDAVRHVLLALGDQDALDEKLAEYAFFPLTHVYNDSRRLSLTCLELAVQCTIILVSKGWRQRLAPAMGKQLLILLSLLAGGDPRNQSEPPSDEVKVASFDCISEIIVQTATTDTARELIDEVGVKTIVDQLVYVLLDAISESPSDQVQLAATSALLALTNATSNHVLLASLLPRTTSALTKALRLSTQARRTRKVLVSDLALLTATLRAVLADSLLFSPDAATLETKAVKDSSSEVLDEAWLRATSPQVKTALTQVVRLQSHDSAEVRHAVAELCLMVIEECARSLSSSLPLMVDTLVSITQNEDDANLRSALKHLLISRPEIAEILRSRFFEWCQILPRMMQGNDNKPKQLLLGQISNALTIAGDDLNSDDDIVSVLSNSLLSSVVGADGLGSQKPRLIEARDHAWSADLIATQNATTTSFAPLILHRSNQKQLSSEFYKLLNVLNQHGMSNQIARLFIDKIPDSSPAEQLAAIWLSLVSLNANDGLLFDLDSIIHHETLSSDLIKSRPYLISDLYSMTLPLLLEEDTTDDSLDWRLKAMALECVTLQAKQLEKAYRPELVDTLYCIVSLLGSNNEQLQAHAITALNNLAVACKYASAKEMLIENVDYLINAVAMKLNAFDISPQAPQVLLMMIKLCGAQIVPYLDDLIGSIFGALDNFHGYPRLVEVLFQVLKTIVDESKAQPRLTIGQSAALPDHLKRVDQCSKVEDILDDLHKRKSRKRKFDEEHETTRKMPDRLSRTGSEKSDEAVKLENHVEDNVGESIELTEKDGKKELTKSHQLLLNIARATSPHLASPSPKVRHILLELLDEVSPLLARDENSFLPLINAIWPTIVPRLLPQTDDFEGGETSYNICAAADLIAILCRGAGNFMSTRIEDLFPQLESFFYRVKSRIGPSRRAKVDAVELVEKSSLVVAGGASRTGDSQILMALIRLLCTVLSYVRVTDTNGEKILTMLAPLSSLPGLRDVRDVLQEYNSDAFWLQEDALRRAPDGLTE